MIRTLIQDTLMAMLLGVVAVAIFILPSINPPAETDPIDPPGNLVVSAAWPSGPIDIDLWVKSPGDEAVGYSRKSGKVFSLLRDDLGTSNDLSGMNFESAYTRGLPDGEYIINLRCYGCAGNVPVPVATEVRLADGALVWSGVVTLVSEKQEKTALRFAMRAGKVVPGSASHVFREIRGAK